MKRLSRILCAIAVCMVGAIQQPWGAQDTRLQDARTALARGESANARTLLDALSVEGNLDAMVLYAQVWEKGQGVTPSRTEALYWYTLAMRRGATAAKEPQARLARELGAERLSAAETRAAAFKPRASSIGRAMDLTNVAYCSYDRAKLGKTMTFRPGASAEQLVADIAEYAGIQPTFIVMAGNVPNAAAVIDDDTHQRLIVYNPAWMDSVTQTTGPVDWQSLSILAHEIGHHVNGHTLMPGGSRPPTELEADHYSGFVLAKMGAAADDATQMMRQMNSPGTDTHPASADRVRAIVAGWEQGSATGVRRGPNLPPASSGGEPPSGGTSGSSVTRRPVSRPEVLVDPMGPTPQMSILMCATQTFSCPMAVPIPPGYSCWCPTPIGPIGGMTVIR